MRWLWCCKQTESFIHMAWTNKLFVIVSWPFCVCQVEILILQWPTTSRPFSVIKQYQFLEFSPRTQGTVSPYGLRGEWGWRSSPACLMAGWRRWGGPAARRSSIRAACIAPGASRNTLRSPPARRTKRLKSPPTHEDTKSGFTLS